jgi:hypothetical protein
LPSPEFTSHLSVLYSVSFLPPAYAGMYRESNTTDNSFVAPNTGNSVRKWYGRKKQYNTCHQLAPRPVQTERTKPVKPEVKRNCWSDTSSDTGVGERKLGAKYGSVPGGQNLTYLTRKESRFLNCALELVLGSLCFKHSTTKGLQVSVITTDYV